MEANKAFAVVAALAVLAVAIAPVGAETAGATGSVTIGDTCGISLDPTSFDFGTMNTGDTSTGDAETTTVYNFGSVPTTDLTIHGADWTDGGTNTFGVGNTHYGLTTGQTWDDRLELKLEASAETLGTGVLANDGYLPTYFNLKIPLGTSAASYTQSITFTSACDAPV